MIENIRYGSSGVGTISGLEIRRPIGKSYTCHLAIIPEDEGGFSVLVLNLPGCGTCGDTIDECMEYIKDAVIGCTECYLDDRESIPWLVDYACEKDDLPANTIYKSIVVSV